LFKVPQINKWLVLATGPKLIEDVRRMTDDQASSFEAIAEVRYFPSSCDFLLIDLALQFLQLDYGVSPDLRLDFYHVEIVGTTLSRQIGARLQEVLDEVQCAFQDEIPPADGWCKFALSFPQLYFALRRVENRPDRRCR
jgi:hypothetical protein